MLTVNVIPDPEGGYHVIDARDEGVLAWRGYEDAAFEIADYLNEIHTNRLWPARDTLVHEIVCARVGGLLI